MATWKKILREDLAVGTGLIKYEASSADVNTLTLTLSDNGTGTDAIALTLGDNLSVASVSAGAATINVTGLATVATSGSYNDLSNTPTIPSAIFSTIAVTGTAGQSNVVADSATDTLTLNAGSNISITTNATTDVITLAVTGLATVATTGAYSDLTGTPTIGNGTITFTGDSYIAPSNSFTLNQTGNQAITFAHATYNNTATSTGQTPAFGSTFNVVSSLTYNLAGHITAANIGTVTLPTPSANFITAVSDTTGQNMIDLTVSSGTLSAVATNLSTTSNVTFNDVTVSGNLTVQGDTTQLNVTTLNVEDKLIKLADVTSPTTTTGNGAGIQVETSATEANWPELLWSNSAALTGWTLSDHVAGTAEDVPVSVMKFAAGAPSAEVYGSGSFYFDTTAKILYVDVA